MYSCQNNFEKFYTEKKTKHMPSGYSVFMSCLFDPTKNKLDRYKDEDCMKSFCKDLREHAVKIMNYGKKVMILLTNEENELYEMQKVYYICNKIFSTDKNDKNGFKGCVHYIFASLFFKSKLEHLSH